MKKIVVAMALVLVFVSFGPTFTYAATDQEIRDAKELLKLVEKSSFDEKLEETRAALDNIERMQLEGDASWESIIMRVFNVSWKLYKKKPTVPETSFLVARSFYYNGRTDKAKRSLKKTFYYDSNYVDAHILKADIELVDAKNDMEQYDDGIDFIQIDQARKRYEKALRLDGVDDEDRSKIFMKIGDLYADMGLDRKKSNAYWEKSFDAAPESFWGKRSQKRMTNTD